MRCHRCGAEVGSRGHRCRTLFCLGTAERAERMLDAGVDANGAPIDDYFRGCLQYSIDTKDRRS